MLNLRQRDLRYHCRSTPGCVLCRSFRGRSLDVSIDVSTQTDVRILDSTLVSGVGRPRLTGLLLTRIYTRTARVYGLYGLSSINTVISLQHSMHHEGSLLRRTASRAALFPHRSLNEQHEANQILRAVSRSGNMEHSFMSTVVTPPIVI